jgi:ribonuclease R
MKKAQYMEKHIGETMEAVISGVTGWGFYAELPNTVEGLVPVSSLRSDYFIFDEENSALVGEHTGKTYQLGETVTVRVTGANRYAGTVDFELEEAEKRGNDGKISTETGREQ